MPLVVDLACGAQRQHSEILAFSGRLTFGT
jgi:hypothetical protein